MARSCYASPFLIEYSASAAGCLQCMHPDTLDSAAERQPLHRHQAIDHHAGFLLGTRETLLETKDGGRTWKQRSIEAAKDEGGSSYPFSHNP